MKAACPIRVGSRDRSFCEYVFSGRSPNSSCSDDERSLLNFPKADLSPIHRCNGSYSRSFVSYSNVSGFVSPLPRWGVKPDGRKNGAETLERYHPVGAGGAAASQDQGRPPHEGKVVLVVWFCCTSCRVFLGLFHPPADVRRHSLFISRPRP